MLNSCELSKKMETNYTVQVYLFTYRTIKPEQQNKEQGQSARPVTVIGDIIQPNDTR